MKREAKIKSLIKQKTGENVSKSHQECQYVIFLTWISGADFIFKFCQNSTGKKRVFGTLYTFQVNSYSPQRDTESETGKPNFLA